METLRQHIEAIIFASPSPVGLDEIRQVLHAYFQAEVAESDVLTALEATREMFASDTFAFELVKVGGGYQFMTKGAHHLLVSMHLKQTTKKRLSQAAMETLAIVAYRQPVSRGEMEEIRGVNCDYALQKLLEKELVQIAGRSEGPGRPLLYGTTPKFMDYMGINALSDLPRLKEFKELENSIGVAESTDSDPGMLSAPQTEH